VKAFLRLFHSMYAMDISNGHSIKQHSASDRTRGKTNLLIILVRLWILLFKKVWAFHTDGSENNRNLRRNPSWVPKCSWFCFWESWKKTNTEFSWTSSCTKIL